MTDSPIISGRDAVLAEASRWFAALDAGTARSDEFEAWRNRDPAHAVAYARIVGNWESLTSGTVQADTIRATRRQWLKTAAIGLPIAVLGSGFLARKAYAWNTAKTGVGETRRVALPDGSVAHLNTDTSLSWRFDRDRRRLRLDRGEVAFDIRGAGGATLQAAGAAFPLAPGLFDAKVIAGRTELTLVDGAALRLPDVSATAILRPNEAIVVDSAAPPRVEARSAERIASLVAWRTGEIVFVDETLAEATADFNRYLTRKIVVRDAGLAREMIGGRFDLDRPDQFLKAVALTLNARVTGTPTGYELTR